MDQSSEARYNFSLADNLHQVVVSLGYKLKKAQCEVDIQCDPKLSIYSFPGSFTQIYSNLIPTPSITVSMAGTGPERSPSRWRSRETSWSSTTVTTAAASPGDIAAHLRSLRHLQAGPGWQRARHHIIYNLVVQLLRGRIHCASEPGQGAQFHIRLPIQQN